MIRKRKRKKKFLGRKKGDEDSNTPINTQKVKKKKKKRSFLFSNQKSKPPNTINNPIFEQTTTNPIIPFPEPIRKRVHNPIELFTKEQAETEYFKIKDAKERRLRGRMGTEDFIPLEKAKKVQFSEVIPKTRMETNKYRKSVYDHEISVGVGDDDEDEESWEMEKIRSGLGIRMNQIKGNEKREKYSVSQQKEYDENENEINKFSWNKLSKHIQNVVREAEEDVEFMEKELSLVNEKIVKEKENIVSFEKDLKYLDEKYKKFSKLVI